METMRGFSQIVAELTYVLKRCPWLPYEPGQGARRYCGSPPEGGLTSTEGSTADSLGMGVTEESNHRHFPISGLNKDGDFPLWGNSMRY